MVWYHGGGFTSGAASMPMYHAENLARKGDVVVVTINHRLNVFGFTNLAELLNREFTTSGNAGMLDAVAALKWVHENIEGFGGDPGNVTIFGESGGGAKVSMLLAMPDAKGLYPPRRHPVRARYPRRKTPRAGQKRRRCCSRSSTSRRPRPAASSRCRWTGS